MMSCGGGTARNNLLYNNAIGIDGAGSDALITGNRVFNSSVVGISRVGATVEGNTLYNNATGIRDLVRPRGPTT